MAYDFLKLKLIWAGISDFVEQCQCIIIYFLADQFFLCFYFIWLSLHGECIFQKLIMNDLVITENDDFRVLLMECLLFSLLKMIKTTTLLAKPKLFDIYISMKLVFSHKKNDDATKLSL